MNRSLAISAANRLAELPRVADAVDRLLAEAGSPQDTVHTVRLILDELFANVVHWAYEGRGNGEIRVRVAAAPEGVTLSIEDDGRAFNPLSAPVPDVQAAPASRAEGGLGIHLVRELADRVTYRRVGNRNVVEALIAAS